MNDLIGDSERTVTEGGGGGCNVVKNTDCLENFHVIQRTIVILCVHTSHMEGNEES
jgi:hypothetical protein